MNEMRRLIWLVETGAPTIDPTLLQGLDLSSLDNFLNSLRKVPRERVEQLQAVLNRMREQVRRPHAGYIELYHGAPQTAAEDIMKRGFQLTKGRRTGPSIPGLEYTTEVDNQGIFLTDSKLLADFFGSNRSEYGNDWKRFTCYVDVTSILDANSLTSGPLIKLGLRLVNDYNGSKLRRLPEREWWWLLDQKEFVDALKAAGYTGVRYRETRAVRHMAGADGDAHTYFIFDPSSIRLKERDGFTVEDFYRWLISQPR